MDTLDEARKIVAEKEKELNDLKMYLKKQEEEYEFKKNISKQNKLIDNWNTKFSRERVCICIDDTFIELYNQGAVLINHQAVLVPSEIKIDFIKRVYVWQVW